MGKLDRGDGRRPSATAYDTKKKEYSFIHGALKTLAIVFYSRMDQRFALPWRCAALILNEQSLKSVCLDAIKAHQRYYSLTGRALYNGSLPLLQENMECHLQPARVRGVLLALDYPSISDPVLLATCKPSKERHTPRDMIQVASTSSKSQVRRYHKELLGFLLILSLTLMDGESRRNFIAGGCRAEYFMATPAPFEPRFTSIGEAWIQPLWRIISEQPKRKKVPRLTYEQFMDAIRRDVGPGELIFNAALCVPLPPPTAVQPQLIPAFECLVHIKCVKDLKRAVVDIANALAQFGVGDAAFSALTPNRMLFQERTLSGTGVVGFVLDLDPLEEPSKIAAYAGPYQDSRAGRLAPYDTLNAQPRIVYLRHALESLFNALVWLYFSNEFSNSTPGLFPRVLPSFEEQWFDPRASILPLERNGYRYERFILQRYEFLLEWKKKPSEPRSAGMRALANEWVRPLRKLIGQAHLNFAQRKTEGGCDRETLGGQFTVAKFMEILA
ncbi:hypothetical protein FB451DRAFT_1562953 [Mycena latifolia]|nr:hypothetical protein FB451DRAFT_1562953 [Mycena latifolia]